MDDPELSGNGLGAFPLITCQLSSNEGEVLMLKINMDTTLSCIVFLAPGVQFIMWSFFFLKGTAGKLSFFSFEITLSYNFLHKNEQNLTNSLTL